MVRSSDHVAPGAAPGPDVVLTALGRQRVAAPRTESAARRDLEVPAGEPGMSGRNLAADESDVEIVVAAPPPTGVKLEGMSAGDPPAKRGSDQQECRLGDGKGHPVFARSSHARDATPGAPGEAVTEDWVSSGSPLIAKNAEVPS